jgi:deoxyadenosine/deoxycytidine kinase
LVKITLAEDEYRLYRNLLILFIGKCLKPDFIFICQNSERLCKIKKRAEAMNKNSGDYLDKINRAILDYIKSQTELNVLIIDVSDKDFVKIKLIIFTFWKK